MTKSGEFNREKYKVVIYHGHIHILANKDELEDRVSSYNRKFLNSNLFLKKKEHN